MANDERFWEASIAEAVTESCPPDVTTRVLQELADQEPKTEPPVAITTKRKVLRGVFRVAAEFAAAAAVMFAIAWLTGLIQFGGKETDPEQRTGPLVYAASPDAVVVEKENSLELKQGWLLVTTGAPPVHCEGSVLTDVDGRVLILAGSMPSREQLESVHPWLNANNLETHMLTNPKRWVTTMTLAALVLTGNAMLDGQRIEAQDEEPAQLVEPEWIQVHSVMDIDKLPADATHVRGVGVQGAHLEFLATHKQITGIDFRDCEGLRWENLEALSALPALSYLDLRGANWDREPSYASLLDFPALKVVGLDFVPESSHFAQRDDAIDNVDDDLKELSGKGIQLKLGGLEQIRGDHLEWICLNLENIRSLGLAANKLIVDLDMKALSSLEGLVELDISWCTGIGELGMAYIAKLESLRSLECTVTLTSAVVHQLTQMEGLEYLFFEPLYPGGDQEGKLPQTLAQLAELPNLTHLHVYGRMDAGDAAPISQFRRIEELRLEWRDYGSDTFRDICQQLSVIAAAGVRRHELEGVRYPGLLCTTKSLSDSSKATMAEIAESEALRELTISVSEVPESVPEAGELALPEVLAKFKKLERIHLRFSSTLDPEQVEAFTEFLKKTLANYEVTTE